VHLATPGRAVARVAEDVPVPAADRQDSLV
jgi:hypothetical protein